MPRRLAERLLHTYLVAPGVRPPCVGWATAIIDGEPGCQAVRASAILGLVVGVSRSPSRSRSQIDRRESAPHSARSQHVPGEGPVATTPQDVFGEEEFLILSDNRDYGDRGESRVDAQWQQALALANLSAQEVAVLRGSDRKHVNGGHPEGPDQFTDASGGLEQIFARSN